jgi:hypothetical protein
MNAKLKEITKHAADDRYCEVAACRIDTRHRATGTIGTREGNAKLIAAAPEMAEALRNIAAWQFDGSRVSEEQVKQYAGMVLAKAGL